MRKLLMGASAILLLNAGMGLAQDDVNPGTGEFEASDQGDAPRPDFVDPNNPDAQYRVWRPMVVGEAMRPTDCVEPGTGQFEPQDIGEDPAPDFASRPCPPGMVPADRMSTGSVEPKVGDPTDLDELFEPSNQADEPTPDVAE